MFAEPFLSRALFQQATALKLFKIGGPRKPQPAVEAVNFYRVLVNGDRLCPYDQHGAKTNSVSPPRSSCTPFLQVVSGELRSVVTALAGGSERKLNILGNLYVQVLQLHLKRSCGELHFL
jgi:hypothetical protein